MDVRIESVEVAGPDGRARRLVFDHADPRETSASTVRLLGLASDDAWDSEELEASLSEAEQTLAKERALRLLGYRDRSRIELTRRLRADGYPEQTTRSVVDRMVEVGLVDDARFASAWAASRAASGMGRRRIRQELSERGIDPSLVLEVLDEVVPQEGEADRARAAAGSTRPAARRDRERLIRRLVTRGFDLSTAARVAGEDDVAGRAADSADDLPIP